MQGAMALVVGLMLALCTSPFCRAAAPDAHLGSPSLDLDLSTYEAIHIAALDHGTDHHMARVLRDELAALYRVHLQIHAGLPERYRRVILIGRSIVTQMALVDVSEFEAIRWDGYLIKAEPHRLIIAGYGPQGTIYGTYAFLKKIGIAFYPWHFGDGLKYYHPIPNAKLSAFSIAEKPYFELRDVLGHRGHGRWGETLRQYTLGELKWAQHRSELRTGGYIGWDHTAGYLVPIQTYMPTHPEFYPMRGGSKIPVTTPTMQVGICACHPALETITLENALTWMSHQPARRFFAITDGDAHGHCPSCAATDPIPDYYTDRNLRWVNAVARGIREQYPDNRVLTLAYQGTVKPPLETGIEPNVLVLYAPWYWTSLATSAVGLDHPLNIIAMEELMAWKRLFPGQIGVYDYPGDWIYGTAERIKMYAQHGIRWVYMNGPRSDLLHWVASQLLWDPKLDVNDLIADYVTAFYGPAAEAMQSYYALRHDTIQRNSLTAFHSLEFFQDLAFLQPARQLLQRAKQLVDKADAHTQIRVMEGLTDHLDEILRVEMAMQTEVEVLRHDFDLYLRWQAELWDFCDRLGCTEKQWKLRLKAFQKSLKRFGLPHVLFASTSQSDRQQATKQARHHVDQYLQKRSAIETQQFSHLPARYVFAFVSPDESQQWQTWASDERLSPLMQKQSFVGLHNNRLSGVGVTLSLSQLPSTTRGRLRVHAGHFRLRRRFEPALDARGQRYISLHLHVSTAVPVTIYLNEKPALRSDINLYPGEQFIRIDTNNFIQRGRGVVDVSKIESVTLDIWPQNLFYPYPDTQDVNLLLLGLRLDHEMPTPESLPHRGKAVWMTHFRPNIPYAERGIESMAVGLKYMHSSRSERFRSSTPHRVLSPISAIVTHPTNHPAGASTVAKLQRSLRTAYGIILPVLNRPQTQAQPPLSNAFFVGPMAALARDRVNFNDRDDAANGFVIVARNGSIAISGNSWEETRKGVDAYLNRHGIYSPSQAMSQSSSLVKTPLFLHEFYLTENLHDKSIR